MIFLIFLCAFFSQSCAMNFQLMDSIKDDTFDDFDNGVTEDGYGRIKSFMQERGFGNEYKHFVGIVKDQELYDIQGLKKEQIFFQSTFYTNLAKKSQKEKDDVLKALLNCKINPADRMKRVLLANCLYAGANANVATTLGITVLGNALIENDISLADIALKHGADSNKKVFMDGSILCKCKSKKMAELMVKNEAKISEAVWCEEYDFVYKVCFVDTCPELLRFSLSYIEPGNPNQYGEKWVNAVKSSYKAKEAKVEFIKILLEHDCRYSENLKNELCEIAGMREVFEDHEYKGKAIKPAKRRKKE